MTISNVLNIYVCVEVFRKAMGRSLVTGVLTFLFLVSGCTPFPACIIVPHPTKQYRVLLVKPADIGKEDYIAFYVLYTQAYGMEHESYDWDSVLALYRHAATFKSPYIKSEDSSAVESRIVELEAKIGSEN